MRLVVRILSGIGLGLSLIFIMFFGSASGLSDSSSSGTGVGGLLVLPFIYFGFCFWSSFGELRGISLLIGGIIAHLCVLPFLIRLFHDGMILFGFPILIMALVWAGMYFESNAKTDA